MLDLNTFPYTLIGTLILLYWLIRLCLWLIDSVLEDDACDCYFCSRQRMTRPYTAFRGETKEKLIEEIKPRQWAMWLNGGQLCGNTNCMICYKRTWTIQRVTAKEPKRKKSK